MKTGFFETGYDGVQLNVNYDWRWEEGGQGGPIDSSDPTNYNFYKGPYPFSETETQAKRDLAIAQRFLTSIDYHSHGEEIWIVYPSNAYMVDFGREIASRISKLYINETYDPKIEDACNGGYSDCWMYGALGTVEFTIETSPHVMPTSHNARQIAEDNLPGALYVLERTLSGPGLTGVIKDDHGIPLQASIKVLETYDSTLAIPTSDIEFGRFRHFLLPGDYTVEIEVPGLYLRTFSNVQVQSTGWTELNVEVITGIEKPQGNNRVVVYPNPITNHLKIQMKDAEFIGCRYHLMSISGQTIHEGLVTENQIELDTRAFPDGIYIIQFIAPDGETVSNKLIKGAL